MKIKDAPRPMHVSWRKLVPSPILEDVQQLCSTSPSATPPPKPPKPVVLVVGADPILEVSVYNITTIFLPLYVSMYVCVYVYTDHTSYLFFGATRIFICLWNSLMYSNTWQTIPPIPEETPSENPPNSLNTKPGKRRSVNIESSDRFSDDEDDDVKEDDEEEEKIAVNTSPSIGMLCTIYIYILY